MHNWQQQYFVLYMYHILFIDYSVIGHLDCFRILAIVNSASVNIGVHISFRIMVFSGYMPRIGIAWSYGTSIFVFLSSLLTSHHRAVRVYMPQCRRVQFSHSVVFYLCNPMDCSTPGFPVHHQLLELAQIHVHWVTDAIQSSHPLSSPSAFSVSQHQGLFRWVNSSHQVAKLLEYQLQYPSFQWIFRTDFL